MVLEPLKYPLFTYLHFYIPDLDQSLFCSQYLISVSPDLAIDKKQKSLDYFNSIENFKRGKG